MIIIWSILGICLLAWLGVGFIAGVKLVYIDNIVDFMNEKIDSGEVVIPADIVHAFDSIRYNKPFFLAIFTLLGIYTFVGDTKRTFRRMSK